MDKEEEEEEKETKKDNQYKLKATTGGPQSSSVPSITRLFHCHRQLLESPGSKIFKTTTGSRKPGHRPPVVALIRPCGFGIDLKIIVWWMGLTPIIF